MLSNNQNDLYFERMNYALDDKMSLIAYVRPGRILDVGAGSGDISKALAILGNEVHALDASYEALELISQVDGVIPVEGTAPSALSKFSENFFDTIICSSVLHEVYSYGESENDSYNLLNIFKTIQEFNRILRTGGRLLIRDGVMPDNWNKEVFVTFSQPEDASDFLSEYSGIAKFYKPGKEKRSVYLDKLAPEAYATNLSSAMEFLFTYNWGFESVDREAKEYYGIYTESEYTRLITDMGFKVLSSNQYIQSGYVEHLSPKATIYDYNGIRVPLPSSNMVIVADKRLSV